MELLQYFSAHHDHAFYLLAGVSFLLELSVMGLGGPLLFFAIASLITGVLISVGVVSGWELEFFVAGVLSAAIAVLLWKPLRKFQNSGGGSDTSSDMIGQQVLTSSEVTVSGGTIRHSGINWNARLVADAAVANIPVSTSCVIAGVDGNVMVVKPL